MLYAQHVQCKCIDINYYVYLYHRLFFEAGSVLSLKVFHAKHIEILIFMRQKVHVQLCGVHVHVHVHVHVDIVLISNTY